MRKINRDTAFDSPTGQSYAANFRRENLAEPQTHDIADVSEAITVIRIGNRKSISLAYDVKASQRRRANRIANKKLVTGTTYTE